MDPGRFDKVGRTLILTLFLSVLFLLQVSYSTADEESWGDYQRSNLIEDAVKFATSKGALICAAAGNENSNNHIYTAVIDNTAVVTVGATNSSDLKASFSNNHLKLKGEACGQL